MRNWHKGRNGAKTVFVLWVCLFSQCSYQVSREKTLLTVYCFPLLLVVCACVRMSVSDLIWHEGLADWSQPLVLFTLPACRGPSDSCCLAVLGLLPKTTRLSGIPFEVISIWDMISPTVSARWTINLNFIMELRTKSKGAKFACRAANIYVHPAAFVL